MCYRMCKRDLSDQDIRASERQFPEWESRESENSIGHEQDIGV